MRGYLFPPGYLAAMNFLGNLTMNATNLRLAFVFPCPKAGQIEEVAYLFKTIATPQTMRVSLQNRAAAPNTYPDDVQDQFCDFTPVANSTNIVGPITSDGTSGGVRRTVAKHEWLCVVLEWAGATGTAVVQRLSNVEHFFTPAFCHLRTGAWQANVQSSHNAALAIRYTGETDWTHVQGLQPMSAESSQVAASVSSTPDEIGARFLAPYNGAKLAGIYSFLAVSQTNNSSFDMLLYDAAGTVLQQTTFSNQNASAFGTGINTTLDFDRASLVELVQGEEYRVVFRPNGAGTVTLRYQDVVSVPMMGATPEGKNCYWTQRTNAGAWSDTTTRAPIMSLLYDDDVPPLTAEVTFNPDDLTPVGLVWVEAFLPT